MHYQLLSRTVTYFITMAELFISPMAIGISSVETGRVARNPRAPGQMWNESGLENELQGATLSLRHRIRRIHHSVHVIRSAVCTVTAIVRIRSQNSETVVKYVIRRVNDQRPLRSTHFLVSKEQTIEVSPESSHDRRQLVHP